jgi:hypothetical protein
MSLIYRKRVSLGRGAHLNLSKSGVSVTARAGGVSLNSRGRVSARLLPGLSYRIGGRR